MDPKTKPTPLTAEATSEAAPPAVLMQEQFTGPLAAQNERTAAEVLAERLAEAASGTDSPAFVP